MCKNCVNIDHLLIILISFRLITISMIWRQVLRHQHKILLLWTLTDKLVMQEQKLCLKVNISSSSSMKDHFPYLTFMWFAFDVYLRFIWFTLLNTIYNQFTFVSSFSLFSSITVKFKIDCPRLVPPLWRARSFPTC